MQLKSQRFIQSRSPPSLVDVTTDLERRAKWLVVFLGDKLRSHKKTKLRKELVRMGKEEWSGRDTGGQATKVCLSSSAQFVGLQPAPLT